MPQPSKPTETAGAGYLCFQPVGEEGEEWAALLVVSPAGLPQEFLYSGPLHPTPVQAILYQVQLGREVRLSLVRSLVRGLRSRPALVAVPGKDLDPAFQHELPCPLVVLREDGGEWLSAPTSASEAALQRLEEVVGVSEPLGRARAALAYVVEYERSRPTSKP